LKLMTSIATNAEKWLTAFTSFITTVLENSDKIMGFFGFIIEYSREIAIVWAGMKLLSFIGALKEVGSILVSLFPLVGSIAAKIASMGSGLLSAVQAASVPGSAVLGAAAPGVATAAGGAASSAAGGAATSAAGGVATGGAMAAGAMVTTALAAGYALYSLGDLMYQSADPERRKNLSASILSVSDEARMAGLSEDMMAPAAQPVQARAAGGPTSPGSPFMVGEKGPELFTPSSAGHITSTQDLISMLNNAVGNNNGEQTVHVQVVLDGAVIQDRMYKTNLRNIS